MSDILFLSIALLFSIYLYCLVKPTKAKAGTKEELDAVLFNISPAPLLIINIDSYTILSANPACNTLYPQESLVGKNLKHVFAQGEEMLESVAYQIAAEGLSQEQLALQKAAHKEQLNTYSSFLKSSSLRLVRLKLVYFKKDNLNIAVLEIKQHDTISILKNNDDLLRASFDSCQHPVFIKNAEGHFVVFNDCYHQTFGTKAENLIGTTGLELIAEEHAAKIAQEDSEVIKQGLVRTTENWVSCANGNKVLFSTSKAPIYNKEGKIIGLIAESTNITERKLEQEAIMREKSILRAIIDAMPDLVFFKDANCRYIGCNKAFENIMGCLEEDIIGKPDSAFVDKSIYERCEYWDNKVLSEGLTVSEELTLKHAGKNITFEIVKTPYVTPENKILGVACVGRDITARKEAELTTKAAKIAADESNNSKSEFLANMSHEIRTPMNAIIGLAHLALQTNLNNKQNDYVSKIHNAGKALLGIINDILDFSKIEANKMEIESVPFSIDDVFENLAAILGQKSAEKGLELIFDIEPNIPESLIGDPLRLGQVLNNLLSNAIKFTEKGEISISCKALAQDSNSLTLEFVVADTGVGMTESQQLSIFKAFGQADASTTRKYGGTGLGLVITERLLEMMGGDVKLKSKYKKGTTITCSAKFALDPANQSQSLERYNSLSNAQVLIVDDNQSSSNAIAALLHKFSATTKILHDPKNALIELQTASANEQSYKVIIIDVDIDNKQFTSGLNLARQIVESNNISNKPAIVLSLSPCMEEVQARAKQEGNDCFLIKPFNRHQLYKAISTAIDISEGTLLIQNCDLVELETHSKPTFMGQKILLVEDNLINQQVASELLEELNLNITICNNGQEAIQLLNNNGDFELIFMDLQMPIMDGYEATNIIRGQRQFDKIPIIAMTAHAMSTERDYCLSLGMNDHLAKPIEVDKLYATLKNWLMQTEAIKASSLTSATKAQAKDPLTDFSKLIGFNHVLALKRINGKAELFLRLLCQFKANYAQAATALRQALDQKEKNEATRMAHTIKGLAGNIGATALYKAADVLEKECVRYEKADSSSLPSEQLEHASFNFATELAICLQTIEQSGLCAEKEESNTKLEQETLMSEQELHQQLLELIELLDNNDADATNVFEKVKSNLNNIEAQATKKIKRDLDAFDFDSAKEAAEYLLNKLTNKQ